MGPVNILISPYENRNGVLVVSRMYVDCALLIIWTNQISTWIYHFRFLKNPSVQC